MLSITSTSRDKVLYPDTNNFRFNLGTALRNVQEVRPVTIVVPKSQYVIDEYNDKIDVDYNNPATRQVVTLTRGNYTVAQFVAHLTASLDTYATSGAPWTVLDNAASGGPATFTITDTGPNFRFLYGSGANTTHSDASIIGSTRGIDTALGSSLTSPYTYDLGGPRNVVIKIETNGHNLGNIYTGTSLGAVFAIVPMNVAHGDVKYHEINSNHQMFKPLTGHESLNYFDVSIYDEATGRPYLLHGSEMSIVVQVLCKNRDR